MDKTDAVIVGWAHSPFGKLDADDIEGLIAMVGTEALEHAGVSPPDVDLVTVGVLNAGFSKQSFEAGLVSVAVPGLEHTAAVRTENACATGSAALHTAMDAIEAGRARIALVVGAEKMTAVSGAEVGDILLAGSYRKEEDDVPAGFAARSRAAISSATATSPRNWR
jgi:acetyl-CoA C-acetyltransferase